MTAQEYYEGDVYLPFAYAKKYKLKRQEENENMYLQGAYNFQAHLIALANAFGKKKIKYLEKPFEIFPKTEAELKYEENQSIKRTVAFLNTLKSNYDKRQKRGG